MTLPIKTSILAVVLALEFAAALPVDDTRPTITGTTQALMYLSKYGYMDPAVTNPESNALIHGDTVREAIIKLQASAGLNMTGELDEETLEVMQLKRCGNKDYVGWGSNARKKRYSLQGSRWRVKALTYKITKYPSGFSRAEVDRETAKAFKVWSDVTPLTFTPVTSGKIHIEIRFERGEHGDGDPFDGPGGTLAHAYFPIYGGDAHFDDTESWTIDSYRGTNMFQVMAHEFGHSLGLSHSDVRSSLMAAFYRGYESNFELDNDDVKGIQALYGKKEEESPAPRPSDSTTAAPAPEDPRLCQGSIDAIVTMSDKETYVFKGSNYWKLTDTGVYAGYPRSISANWGGLPANLDAAFTWTNGKTYFFKADKYWRYTDMTLDSDYPKEISRGFAGIPNNVDAAFVWSGNGKIYFFKGSQYWRFDPAQRPPVKEIYPKRVSNWDGIPNNIDDALQYSNGYTYFFKGGQYWRFNDRLFQVDSADPSFPRSAGQWWFGCETSGNQLAPETPGADDTDIGEDTSFDAVSGRRPSKPPGSPSLTTVVHDGGLRVYLQLASKFAK